MRIAWIGAGLGFALSLSMACGDGAEDIGPATVPETASPASSASPDLSNPDTLGTQIAADFQAMLAELKTILEGEPAAANVADDVQALKDEYIETFVEYGRLREAMSDDEKAAVASAALREVQAFPPGFMTPLVEANTHYNAGGTAEDREVASLISSMSILTQYSFFELLKEQAPQEAERLGIE